MKRALKEKVKAVLENPASDDAPVEQLNVVTPYVNRRVRTKAAMIGLAISMGATSLLVTRQGDQAQGAAPVGNQNTASTIPAAPNTELKFAPTQKLEYQAASSVSVPESPRIVEPTAISQVPGLQAKLELAAPVVGRTTTTIQQSVNFQPKIAEKQSIPKSYASIASDRNGIAGADSISLNAQPQTVVSPRTANSGEVNSQLRAQQDFAINRLQEKSNRLRRSLAELRSEETKLSQTTNEVAQPTIAVEKTPQLNANNTALQPSKNATDASQASLVTRLKQAKVGNARIIPVPAPTVATNARLIPSGLTAYEVKPGDTLAAIASERGTSVSEIIKANNLNNPNELRINQKLTVPAENRSTAIKPIAAVTPVQSGSAPKIVTPANTLSAGLTFSEPSQPSVTANNGSVTIPTAVTSDNQIQATAIKPTTDLTTAPAYGIGGDSPIPQKLNQMQLAKKPPEVTRTKNNNPRLRSLQDEIERLRTKYRAQQSGNIVVPTESPSNEAAVQIPVSRPDNFAGSNPVTRVNNVAVPIPVPRPMAPNYIAQPQPQFRATGSNNDSVNPDFVFNQTSRQSNPRGNRPSVRIATPPIGVDASASLGAMRGRIVSPDLPPLTAAVDRYLPRAIDPSMPAPSTMTTAYIWPAKGVLTSGFGMRWGRPHKGIDVANGTGTPIYASADGVIEKAGWNNGGYGNVVDIRHNDGSMTRYGHNSKILVQAGQAVHQGDIIAKMGSTGFSTGPHSHFEIHPSGKGAVNPIAFLPNRV